MKNACNDTSTVRYREYIVLNNEQIDIKGELDATAYKDTTFFGTFCLKTLKFDASNEIDYQKKEFDYYKQVNDTPIKIGHFYVTDVSDVDTYENVTVTCYDSGLKFANPYTTSLNYSGGNVTMMDVVEEICDNVNIDLENQSLPNGSFIVDSNQFINDEQYGDVISIVALENGMFATINENNKLEFIFNKYTNDDVFEILTENSENILTEDSEELYGNSRDTINNYEELEDKRNTRPITCVLVAPSEELASSGAIRQDSALISKYGENWLKIYDYAFAYSTAKCESLIGNIFNQVKGFGYTSFEATGTFKPYYKLGDLISYRTKDGTIRNSIVLRIHSEYENITISAPSITDASVEYTQPETTEQLIKDAQLEINRANGQIVLKATSNGNLVQAELNADASEGTSFNVKADNVNFSGKNFNVTSDNLKITIGTGTNQTDIINSNGVLTNLVYNGYVYGSMFNGSGTFVPFGRVGGYGDTYDTQINKMVFSFDLPNNFVVNSARIYIYHAPVNWTGIEGYSTITGRAKNLKIYKGYNESSLKLNVDMNNLSTYFSGAYDSQISNSWQGYGSSAFSGNTSGESDCYSVDLKDYIDNGTENMFIVKDIDNVVYTSNSDIFGNSGSLWGYIEIIGYTQV